MLARMKRAKLTLARAKVVISRQQADAVRAVLDVRRAKNLKEDAYTERDAMLAVLSRVFPSHLMQHHDPRKDEQNQSWKTVVCIHSPAGQLSWAIPDERMAYFAHLESTENDWDGCTKPERADRLRNLNASAYFPLQALPCECTDQTPDSPWCRACGGRIVADE